MRDIHAYTVPVTTSHVLTKALWCTLYTKILQKLVVATEKAKPAMESTQARLLRKYKQASIVYSK